MSILDRLFGKRAKPKANEGLIPGRPSQAKQYYYTRPWGAWSRQTAQGYKSLTTLREIRDYNPDAAMAVWNFLRLVGKDARLDVLRLDGSADKKSQARLDAFLPTIGVLYGGGLGTLVGVATLTLITQGAVSGELDLSESFEPVDWCPVDPSLITFITDKDSGRVYPAIGFTGKPDELPAAQFRYVPMDPDIDDPYGRAPFWPALEVTFFQMEVLRDLRAVAHTAGYPHIDVGVVYQSAWDNLPAHLRQPGKENDARVWMDGILTDIQESYNDLQPDDVWVHWDIAKPGYVGPGQAGTINLNSLIQVLDQQVVASLKQMPILLGRNFGSTETHANRQWEIFVEGIGAIRAVVARLLEFWGNETLRLWGVQGTTKAYFARLRSTDRFQDAQAARLETDTAIRQMLAGFVNQEEAAQSVTGHGAMGPVTLPELAGIVISTEAPVATQAMGQRGQRQDGEGDEPDETAEVALTPDWMQALWKESAGGLGEMARNAHARGLRRLKEKVG